MLSRYQPNNGRRRNVGLVLAEATAGTVIFILLVIVLLFVMIQSCICIHILNGLTQGARDGARKMALLYAKSGGGASPTSSAVNSALQRIQVAGIVNQSSQFNVAWPASYGKNSHPQPTVTVTCYAAPGQSGGASGVDNITLPVNVLSLFGQNFSLQQLSLRASATYPLRP